MFGNNSVFEYLRWGLESEDLVDDFVSAFGEVVENNYDQLTAPKSLYDAINSQINRSDTVGVEDLKRIEDHFFGSGNFVGYSLEDCFDEAVAETYHQMDYGFLDDAAQRISNRLDES